MQLVCPSCAAAYTIKPGALGTTGRTVRCPACATTWFAWPPAADGAPAGGDASLPHAAEPEPAAQPAAEVIPPQPAAEEPSGPTNIETAARRVRPKSTPKRRPPGAPTAAGAFNGLFVMAAFAFLIGCALVWRQDAVRLVPDLAGLYARIGLPVNVRGLEFRELAARVDFEAGQPVTIIEGAIVNVTGDQLAVPRLRYSVRGLDGRELVSWAGPAPRPTIAPRESLPFRGRLTTPVPGGNDIEVRFLARSEGGRGVP